MSDQLDLSPEEIKLFDEFYQRRLAEVGGAWDDAQELEIARDILAAVVNDGLTPTADGGASYVRRGAVDWTDPTTMQAAQATMGPDRPTPAPVGPAKQRGRSELWQGLGVLVLALLAGAWFLWPSGEEDASAEATEVEVTAEATQVVRLPQGAVTQTPVPTLEAELLADIVGAGVKTKELVVPRTLEIKGVSFIVQPVNTTQGDWRSPGDERAVSWIYGTVINYVLGLEATADNKALLASLQPGDALLLRASTGRPVYRFAYADTIRVAPQASEIFQQKRPGLTLVLLNDAVDDARIVVRGIYLPASELDTAELEPVANVAVGKKVVLDDLVGLTCLGRELIAGQDPPPGYAYLGVNYVVEQLGGELPLVTAAFFHSLQAGGLVYPSVSIAKELMSYPALPETLIVGQPVTATLVYAVPEPALRETMIWQFAPDPAGTRAQVELPRFAGQLAPEITLREANLADNRYLNLILTVQAGLYNVDIEDKDIAIQGGVLDPVVNRFPWRVAASQKKEFGLVILPDDSNPVTVIILEQGFELTY
jgi:hypothetical protein